MQNILREAVERFKLGGFGICEFSDISMHLIKCRAINRIPDNAGSVIVFIFPYYVNIGKHNVSRYAVIRDYHEVVINILEKVCSALREKHKEFTFVPFSDNSPIPEVRAGVLAGLGVLGENNLLINNRYGSWVFIGEIVTNMSIRHERFKIKKCNGCGACKADCPSGALSGKEFKKDICLSCVTQKKKLVSERERDLIKTSPIIWGCDICQESCPMNTNKESTSIIDFTEGTHENVRIGDYDLLKNRAYHWREKEVIERNIKLQLNLSNYEQ